MGLYLLIGLIFAVVIYRKALLEIVMAVVTWPWILIKALRMSGKDKEEES